MYPCFCSRKTHCRVNAHCSSTFCRYAAIASYTYNQLRPKVSSPSQTSHFIIHQVKTKRKSQPWRRFGSLARVVISIHFDDFTSPFTPFLFRLTRYIKHSRLCFISYPNTIKFRQKYSAARRVLNSPLGVWISRWNTVSRCLIYYLKNRTA